MSREDNLLPSSPTVRYPQPLSMPQTDATSAQEPLNHSIWLSTFAHLRSSDPTLTEESFVQFLAEDVDVLKTELLDVLLRRYGTWRARRG